jgi:hypothetical protein
MNDVTITTTTVADTPSNGATGNRAQLTSLGFARGHMCSGNLSGCKCSTFSALDHFASKSKPTGMSSSVLSHASPWSARIGNPSGNLHT